MADETAGDKTEAPTPRRRQEARDSGQVARSPDLSAAALLIGILILIRCFGSAIISAMKLVVAEMLAGDSLSNLDPGATAVQVARSAAGIGIAMMPLLLGIVMISIIVNMAQVGLNLNFARVTPNIEALNPVRGLSRLLGGRRVLVRLAMSFLKVIFVTMTAYSAVHGHMAEIMSAQQLSFVQIFGLGAGIVYSITLRIGFLLLVLSLIDYGYQRYQLEHDLMMSKQEVKEEMKRMDGDPRVKQRRRQIAVQRHLKRLKKEVPTADAVITNPTHFAVALKYDAQKMRAPRVVAKGQDLMAKRIREIAIEAGVPLIERPPLARALYKMCDVGDEIPEQFYSAVAEILAYVYQLARNAGKPESMLRRAG
jgi:flagellar biosynthetic protein FlhB